ncbi:hypothetical protein CTI12_AA218960 [Artemisia annua]|uniref:Ulp1 protease family, C-terminal catalytic domain-containing protein n=1 Tax=Artemisia annua TaxID=35608 RepID=A0A2U1NWU3_ARTAN|nr:hypothetical protein CTI12_AA218960 [Artemisia annua]
METLAPSLWIDNNVVDCWGAILNYEESAKKDPSPKKNAKKDPSPKRHFFPTGCIRLWLKELLAKEEQWDIFSAEISAHLKNVDASKFLAEIELAFFPIQVSSHFYVVVFNIKKSVTSMIILDNSLQTYVAKYKDAYDLLCLKMGCGLCPESEKQASLLRRMRFKIATKILLHELNLHSQKMYDLAFKFQSEIAEQTRISIIVNAIKNRADRDPEKDVRKENVLKIDVDK